MNEKKSPTSKVEIEHALNEEGVNPVAARDELDWVHRGAIIGTEVFAVNDDVVGASWNSDDTVTVTVWDAGDYEAMGDHVKSDPFPSPGPLASVELSAASARRLAVTLLAVATTIDDLAGRNSHTS